LSIQAIGSEPEGGGSPPPEAARRVGAGACAVATVGRQLSGSLVVGSTPSHARDYNDYMRSMTIGIREAKAQLSWLVKDVGQGTEWVITDRGRPVAKLVPVGDEPRPLAERVQQLEAWGWIAKTDPARQPLPPPLPLPEGVAQDVLQRDREQR
jgi:prevent-host-death family protein